jgi:hypothetical protein
VIDSLLYLGETYWPYLLGAVAIGVVAGWFSVRPAKK